MGLLAFSLLLLAGYAPGVHGGDGIGDSGDVEVFHEVEFDAQKALVEGRERLAALDWPSLFGKLDTDGSGGVNATEVVRMLRVAEAHISRQELARLRPEVQAATDEEFAALDADGNERLTRRELGVHAEGAAATDTGGSEHGRMNRLWSHADRDSDGELSPAEYVVFQHPELDEHGDFTAGQDAHAVHASALFAAVDADGDEVVTAQEYEDHRLQKHTETPESAEEEEVGDADLAAELELFSAADADGDSALSPGEWGRFQMALADRGWRDEAEGMLEECDKDKDGVLKVEEIQACLHLAGDHMQHVFLAHDEL
eukprot:g5711.t1